MGDITDPRGAKREIEQEAHRDYEPLSGVHLARRGDGSIQPQGHNDALDAFRHAYASGRVTQIARGQQWIARRFGNDAELGPAHPNDPYEHRMDLWNNEAARRIGDRTSGADQLARETYAAVQRGELVTGLGDPRLRQLYPDDPRLRLPAGDPRRELGDKDAVDRINQDVVQHQDRAHERFPERHPDRAYFDALCDRLPDAVSDAKVAQVLVAAKQAGIERVDQPGAVTLQDQRIFVAGRTPGFRTQVDADGPAPAIRDSAYQAEQQSATQAHAQSQHQTQGPSRAY